MASVLMQRTSLVNYSLENHSELTLLGLQLFLRTFLFSVYCMPFKRFLLRQFLIPFATFVFTLSRCFLPKSAIPRNVRMSGMPCYMKFYDSEHSQILFVWPIFCA